MAAFTFALTIALVGSIVASDTIEISKRGLAEVNIPAPTDVQGAINDWNTDVVTVNNFLNDVPNLINDLPTLAAHAQNILDNNAKDEPNQLKTLRNWFTGPSTPDLTTDAFECAFDDLATGQVINGATFNFDMHVIKQLSDFVIPDAQAGNADFVTSQVGEISSYRCCNVLPDLDILWRDAAISAGFAEVDVPRSPPRPDACASIDCSTTVGASTCGSKDNGRFGAPGS